MDFGMVEPLPLVSRNNWIKTGRSSLTKWLNPAWIDPAK